MDQRSSFPEQMYVVPRVDYCAMERARAELDMIEFTTQVAANGERLTPLPGHELVVGASGCWFMRTGVLFDKRGNEDRTGTLYLTTEETIFRRSRPQTVL